MQRHRFLSSLIVAVALLAPVSAQAAGGAKVSVRVYDRSHKDYHVWDGREDHAYRQYLGDQHMKYRRYSTLNRKRQTTYWTWRHTQGSDR